jgi:predicted membrane channel-forming protein YqfA (hemolysin III family)
MKSLRMISYVIMALGVLVFIVGLLFKIQHWPDMFNGLTTGLVLIIIGTVFFIISLVKRQKNNAL